MPYRFALDACVGREKVVNGEKEVEPFRTSQEVEAWLKAVGPKFGFKPDFFNATIKELQFPYGDRTVKLPYASIEGVLQINDAELIKRPLLRGIGSYRRVGLGLCSYLTSARSEGRRPRAPFFFLFALRLASGICADMKLLPKVKTGCSR